MSYSAQLKKEIMTGRPVAGEARIMEIAGILLCTASIDSFSQDNVSFSVKTENPGFARYLYMQIEKAFGVVPQITTNRSNRFRSHRSYRIVYENGVDVLSGTGYLAKGKMGWYSPVLNTVFDKQPYDARMFLRGVFLACGTLSDPEKSYHLELAPRSTALSDTCYELMKELGLKPGFISRGSTDMLYLKEAEAISEFLGLIGANRAKMRFEEQRIVKEMRNGINRQVNCETANMNKTAKAAGEEICAIEVLEAQGKLETLDAGLQAAAALRKENPETPISELCVIGGLSRSTLYRRLKKLITLAGSAGEEG